MTDAELCRRALEAQHWKQRELAAYLEMHEQHVSNVLHGRRDLPEGKRYLLGELMDMRPTQVRRLMATALTAVAVVNLLLTPSTAEALTTLVIAYSDLCIMLSLGLLWKSAAGVVPKPGLDDRRRDTGRRRADEWDQYRPPTGGFFLP